jgi:ABC-type multidrug transport system fused ATPase/permease subunit
VIAMLADPSAETPSGTSTSPSGGTSTEAGRPLLRALALLSGHHGLLVAVLATTIAAVLVGLLTPWLFGQAIGAIEAEDESRIVVLGLAVVGAGIVAALVSALRQLLSGRLAVDVELTLREKVYAHLLGLDSEFYATRSVGDLVSVIMVTSGPIRQFLAVALPRITSDLLTFVFAGVAMAVIDPRLALAALWPIPITIYCVVRMARIVTPQKTRRQETMADVTASAEETLRGMLTVDVLAAQEARGDRFQDETGRWYVISNGIARSSARYDAAIQNLPNLAWAGLFAWGGLSVVEGRLALSTFVTFLGYVGLMLAPIANLGYRLWTTQSASASAHRVFEVLDRPPLITDRSDAAPLTGADRAIAVRNVSKTFDGMLNALDAVELDIAARRNVAIVGPSGSGKSALLDLLTRVHDPEAGEIAVGGTPIDAIRLASLRSAVVAVGSAPHLFPMSVFDNIAYGAPQVTIAEVQRITSALGVHDDLAALPDGYSTIVGETGLAVPTSLAQCISIARALALHPAVLLLDDVTAPLPPPVEAAVVDGLRQLTGDVTVVAVAARPSLLALADDIVFLEHGAVGAQGTYDELVRTSPGFRQLLEAWRLDRAATTLGDQT